MGKTPWLSEDGSFIHWLLALHLHFFAIILKLKKLCVISELILIFSFYLMVTSHVSKESEVCYVWNSKRLMGNTLEMDFWRECSKNTFDIYIC